MSTPTSASTATSAVPGPSFRSVVLPREHGSWSLAFEPVALGLLVAPSAAGGWLAAAIAAGFFVRRPLKLAATLPSSDPRRAAAVRWTLLFATLALTALFVAAPAEAGFLRNTQDSSWAALWPLLLSVPFGAAFLWFDLRNEMREAEAEFAGSIAFALVPAAFATLSGWSAAPALGVAVLMLTRSVPTVLTVRTYLRLAKGKPAHAWPAVVTAAGTVAAIAALAALQVVPAAAGAPVALLALRTVFLLSPFPPQWSARRVGMMEGVLGLIFVAGVAFAYRAP